MHRFHLSCTVRPQIIVDGHVAIVHVFSQVSVFEKTMLAEFTEEKAVVPTKGETLETKEKMLNLHDSVVPHSELVKATSEMPPGRMYQKYQL